jgi:hypothetical protein
LRATPRGCGFQPQIHRVLLDRLGILGLSNEKLGPLKAINRKRAPACKKRKAPGVSAGGSQLIGLSPGQAFSVSRAAIQTCAPMTRAA